LGESGGVRVIAFIAAFTGHSCGELNTVGIGEASTVGRATPSSSAPNLRRTCPRPARGHVPTASVIRSHP